MHMKNAMGNKWNGPFILSWTTNSSWNISLFIFAPSWSSCYKRIQLLFSHIMASSVSNTINTDVYTYGFLFQEKIKKRDKGLRLLNFSLSSRSDFIIKSDWSILKQNSHLTNEMSEIWCSEKILYFLGPNSNWQRDSIKLHVAQKYTHYLTNMA